MSPIALLPRMGRALFPPIPAGSPADRSVRRFLILLTIATMLGFQLWRSLFNNFAVEEASIDAAAMGLIQSVREIPGFLALLVVYIIMVVREQSLATLSVALFGLGIALTGFFPHLPGLLVTTLVMSFGFHYFETVNQSMTLQYLPRDQAPQFLGQVRAWSSAAAIVSVGAVFLLAAALPYRPLFLLGGSVVFVASIVAVLRFPRFEPRVRQRTRMIVRRRYWLFYVLTFLSGARRQVFVAFALFLMVKNFGFSVREITLLFLVNNLINLALSPAIGGMVHRIGERKVISLEYGGLILVFLGYALTGSKAVVMGLYILDHVFFNMSLAIKTYFQKIADPRDIAPSMAVAFTINHIAAVAIPVAGGLVWMIDYRWTFFGGVLLAALSLTFAQWVRTEPGAAPLPSLVPGIAGRASLHEPEIVTPVTPGAEIGVVARAAAPPVMPAAPPAVHAPSAPVTTEVTIPESAAESGTS